jgi:hypothetical protein
MKLKCLCCEALARPVYLHAALSSNVVDVELVRLGLHNHPNTLRSSLQEKIDVTEGYDAVILAYGLCGKATAGLVARDAPLVIPRAHDCITLFLGSRQRYQVEFEAEPGTYWYTKDYLERRDGQGEALGTGLDLDLSAVYDEYVEKYGKDNADYLMEVMGAWQAHYRRAVFVDLGVGDASSIKQFAKQEASRRDWIFQRLTGDLILLRQLLAGEWGEDFLVVNPGEAIVMEPGIDILRAGQLQ